LDPSDRSPDLPEIIEFDELNEGNTDPEPPVIIGTLQKAKKKKKLGKQE
jgi:hypothetical protein